MMAFKYLQWEEDILFMKNVFHNKIDFNAIEMICQPSSINHCILIA